MHGKWACIRWSDTDRLSSIEMADRQTKSRARTNGQVKRREKCQQHPPTLTWPQSSRPCSCCSCPASRTVHIYRATCCASLLWDLTLRDPENPFLRVNFWFVLWYKSTVVKLYLVYRLSCVFRRRLRIQRQRDGCCVLLHYGTCGGIRDMTGPLSRPSTAT